MKMTLVTVFLILSFCTKAQSGGGIELSYRFTPNSIIHYDLTNPGSYKYKYRQQYNYLATLKLNKNIRKSSLGAGFRGYWPNRDEKAIGVELDYLHHFKVDSSLLWGLGLSANWDKYRFRNYQNRGTIELNNETISLLISGKLEYRFKPKWGLKTVVGLGIGFNQSDYKWLQDYSRDFETIHKDNFRSSPFLATSMSLGIVRYMMRKAKN